MIINYHKFITCLNSSNTCCVLFSRWSGTCVRRYACSHCLLSALHMIGTIKPQISVSIMSTDVWCCGEMYWEPPRVIHWARYKAMQSCCVMGMDYPCLIRQLPSCLVTWLVVSWEYILYSWGSCWEYLLYSQWSWESEIEEGQLMPITVSLQYSTTSLGSRSFLKVSSPQHYVPCWYQTALGWARGIWQCLVMICVTVSRCHKLGKFYVQKQSSLYTNLGSCAILRAQSMSHLSVESLCCALLWVQSPSHSVLDCLSDGGPMEVQWCFSGPSSSVKSSACWPDGPFLLCWSCDLS